MKTFGHGVQHPYLFPVTAVCRSLPSIFTCCCQINFFKHSPALSGSLLQSFQFFSLPTGLSAESFGSRKALHVLACSSPTPHEVRGNTAARAGARPGTERRADAPLREVALGGPDGLHTSCLGSECFALLPAWNGIFPNAFCKNSIFQGLHLILWGKNLI